MVVADRYDEYLDTTASYAGNRSRRISYYADEAYDDRYEADRRVTTDEERERLMNSLERRGSHHRVERRDESRYDYYVRNAAPAENNYDMLLDRRAAQGTSKEKKVLSKKKLPFVVAYVVFAFAAVLAVTLSLVGVKQTQASVDMSAKSIVEASAEESLLLGEEVSAVQEEAPVVKEGGEVYVMLKTGELIAVEVPEIAETTKEEENWFDKFCNWLNGIFGGSR